MIKFFKLFEFLFANKFTFYYRTYEYGKFFQILSKNSVLKAREELNSDIDQWIS